MHIHQVAAVFAAIDDVYVLGSRYDVSEGSRTEMVPHCSLFYLSFLSVISLSHLSLSFICHFSVKFLSQISLTCFSRFSQVEAHGAASRSGLPVRFYGPFLSHLTPSTDYPPHSRSISGLFQA